MGRSLTRDESRTTTTGSPGDTPRAEYQRFSGITQAILLAILWYSMVTIMASDHRVLPLDRRRGVDQTVYKPFNPSEVRMYYVIIHRQANMTSPEDAMDFVASLGTSGESSWSGSGSGSTSLTTPASSPLFGPSKGDNLALSPSLSSPGLGYVSFQGPAAWSAVRNVCVVGAGYVGRLVC